MKHLDRLIATWLGLTVTAWLFTLLLPVAIGLAPAFWTVWAGVALAFLSARVIGLGFRGSNAYRVVG